MSLLRALPLSLVIAISTACSVEPPYAPRPDSGVIPDGGSAPDGGTLPDGGTQPDGGTGELCPPWGGDVQLGGAASDELFELLALPSGELVALGYFDGTVDDDGPAGAAVATAIVLGADGRERARHVLPGSGARTFDSAIVDGDTIVAVGRTRGTFPGYSNFGDMDAFVARYSPAAGVFSDIRPFGDERPQHPRGLVRLASGELAVGGYDEAWVPTNYVEAWENPTITWLTGAGTPASPWSVRHGLRATTPGSDYGFAIAAANDGSSDVFFSGQRLSGAGRGAFVQRVTPSGDVLWEATLSAVGFDAANALTVAGDGTVVVAGSTFLTLGAESFGEQDFFVAWLDPSDGAVLGATQAGGPDSEWVTDVLVDHRGHVFVAGYTYGDVVRPNVGEADVLVVELAPMTVSDVEAGVRRDARASSSGDRAERGVEPGAWLSTWQRGSAGFDEPWALAEDRCGRIFVAGDTDGALAGEHAGRRDGFVMRVGE
ncbi:hypothetical protein L6R52_23190 [Myxococcota bacterium]|nr:hypothetical protein [Myxococcota bacterium]